MGEVNDVVEDYGLIKLRDVEYIGNFTIKYIYIKRAVSTPTIVFWSQKK